MLLTCFFSGQCADLTGAVCEVDQQDDGGDMTREEERLFKVLTEYIRQRKNFFKESTQPALREWKGADVKLAEAWNRYQAEIHKAKEKK